MKYRGLAIGAVGILSGLISLIFSFASNHTFFIAFFWAGFIFVLAGGAIHLQSMAERHGRKR